SAPTIFAWVKGYASNARNKGADAEALHGTLCDDADSTLLTIDPVFDISGAKLRFLTQSLAYHGL
ncbi:uncharacterized protein PHACADRAFT_108561, partial [Phanerochaete carnosa HHB-10118-sp]